MSKPSAVIPLVLRAQSALALTHREFGPLLGSSQRTAERWAAARSTPSPDQLAALARHVHPRAPGLAAELAAAIGQSLLSLGLEKPVAVPEPVPEPVREPAVKPALLVDLVVCACAEAMDVSPREVRPVLHVAFTRALELGLDVAAVASALAPPPAPRRRPRRA